ncbi:MAG: J domain-containing protein [Spirochaetia bacterium]
MEKYDRITNARKILGLHETETLTCIKNKYKKLIKAFHPDVCEMDPAESKRKTEQLNDAYKVILEYCNNYQYSFTREEVEKHLSPEEFWRNHFGNDPLWGNTMKNKE